MTRLQKIVLTVLAVPLLGLLTILLTLYSFIAEDVFWMRPFNWTELPETYPYTEGIVASNYKEAAGSARDLLRDHISYINVPAFSAAVAVGDKLIWSASIGYADLEQNRKATPNTLFRIGSTSKAVTGTLFARMVDRDIIDIDTPISVYVEDLPNVNWEQITPRQLASHTAGIVGYEENRDLIGAYGSMLLQKSHYNVEEGLQYFDGSELLHEPSTNFHYSSFDAILLSVILQKAGKAPFLELMHEQVLCPLALDSPLPDAPHPDRATFYHVRDGEAQRWRMVDLSMKLAGGGFMATPSDLALLGVAWLDDEFISAETRQQFWTPQTLASGTVNDQNYALNWRVSKVKEDIPFTYMHHGGVSKGAMAWLAVIPEHRMAIALTINARIQPFNRWSGIFSDLVQIFADQPMEDFNLHNDSQ